MLRWLWWLLSAPVRLPLLALLMLKDRLAPIRTLEVTLRGKLHDFEHTEAPWSRSSTSLLGLVSCLALAEADPRLRRLVVTVEEFSPGLARAEELRSALSRLVVAGKEVIVIASQLTLSTYWLGLGASRIIITPAGGVDLTGVASGFTLYKGLLDKVGVSAQLVARGAYKSMREVFAADEISEANREMLEQLTEDLFAQLVERISTARHLDVERVRQILDQGPFRAQEALRHGLVDELEYEQRLRIDWKKQHGRVAAPARYTKSRSRRWLPQRRHRVAVLEVNGAIAMGGARGFGRRSTTARRFLAALRAVERDRSVRALLVRVDSPGGSALASDLMWQALTAAKGDRPCVISMGNVAASGGYYVAGVKGAQVFAGPCTITGSIGVVAGKFELSELYRKLGIGHAFIARGKNAGYHSPLQAWTPEQLAKLEADVGELYRDFVEKMADGRGMTFEALEQVARGRVWTGRRALEHRLVDHQGGLREAMDAVREGLGLSDASPLDWTQLGRPSLLERVMARGDSADAANAAFAALPRQLRALLAAPPFDDTSERLWLHMPFDAHFD